MATNTNDQRRLIADGYRSEDWDAYTRPALGASWKRHPDASTFLSREGARDFIDAGDPDLRRVIGVQHSEEVHIS